MRFRADDDISEPLAFELGDDWGDGGSDVTFGSSGSGGPSRRWQVAGGVAAIAVVLGGALFLGRGGDEAAAPDTTVVVPTTTAPRPSTTPTRPRRSTTTTVPVPYTPPPAFATDPGWDIYVGTYTATSNLQVFDPTTGSIESADLPLVGTPGNGPGQVERGPAGPVEVTYGDFGMPAVLPDGTAWFWDGAGSLVRRPLGAVDAVYRGSLGTTADGRPAVVLPDGQMYGVQLDGSLLRVVDGLTYDLRLGQYTLTECSETGACSRRIHGRGGEIVIPAASVEFNSTIEFSPTGNHAAVLDLDYQRGTSRLVVYDLVSGAELYAESRMSFTGGSMKWSPDGRYLITLGSRVLLAIDVQTGETIDVPVPKLLSNHFVAGVV